VLITHSLEQRCMQEVTVVDMFVSQRTLNGCSARLVPKCLEMPVIFKPSLDWLDGIG